MDTRVCVSYPFEGIISDPIEFMSGMPPRIGTGTFIFLIFVNDTHTCATSHLRMFANECVVYRCTRGDERSRHLQANLIQ